MKPGPWRVLCVAVAGLSLASCTTAAPPPASPGPEPAVESADGLVRPGEDNRAVLHVGQVLEIALETNPSTGYQWQVTADGSPALARTTGPATPPPMDTQAPMPGAPRIARWWFRAERAGEATVKLEYRRPWEKEAPAAEVVEYVVTIE